MWFGKLETYYSWWKCENCYLYRNIPISTLMVYEKNEFYFVLLIFIRNKYLRWWCLKSETFPLIWGEFGISLVWRLLWQTQRGWPMLSQGVISAGHVTTVYWTVFKLPVMYHQEQKGHNIIHTLFRNKHWCLVL